MSGVPWLFLAGVGWMRLGRAALVLLAVCGVVYYLVVFLQDVVGVLRPNGAPCTQDSNCLSLCHRPPLRPDTGYCSSDCSGKGSCGAGVCRRVTEGWRCVADGRVRFGDECGEDSECLSGRCMGFYARDGKRLEPADARPSDFRGGFCVQLCQSRWDCPIESDGCVTAAPNTFKVCAPVL